MYLIRRIFSISFFNKGEFLPCKNIANIGAEDCNFQKKIIFAYANTIYVLIY